MGQPSCIHPDGNGVCRHPIYQLESMDKWRHRHAGQVSNSHTLNHEPIPGAQCEECEVTGGLPIELLSGEYDLVRCIVCKGLGYVPV